MIRTGWACWATPGRRGTSNWSATCGTRCTCTRRQRNLATIGASRGARCIAQPTLVNRVLSIAALVWSAAALTSLNYGALAIAFAASGVALVQNVRSRRQCLAAATSLVARAGEQAGLTPVSPRGEASASDAELPRSPDMVERPVQEYALSPLAGDPMTA